MKTIKITFLILLCLSFTFFPKHSKSQSIYFDLTPGYALNFMPNTVSNVYFNELTTIAPTVDPGSYGKGWNYGATAGYFFLPYLAFEVGFNQFSGNSLNYSQFLSVNSTQSITLNESSSGKMFRICPAIKLSTFNGKIPPYNKNTAKDGGRWVDYYAKLGLIFGLSPTITANQTLTHADTTSVLAYNSTSVFSGGSSLGLNIKLGASFKQNEHIFLFVELSFIDQFYSPTQSTITSYSYGGADMLGTLTNNQKQTNYVAQPTYKSNGPNEPSQGALVSYPFTSIGLNVGIEFKFDR